MFRKPQSGIIRQEGTRRTLLQRVWDSKFVYAILLPTFILLIVFSYYPFFNALYRSLFDWNGVNVSNYVGLANFSELLSMKVITFDPVVNEETGEPLINEEGSYEYPRLLRYIREYRDEYDGFKELTTFQLGNQMHHVIAKDPVFLQSSVNMIIFVIADLLKATLIPLLLANLIYHLWSYRMRYLFRILLILPAVVPGVVMTLLWRDFFKMPTGGEGTAGLVNQVLGAINPEWQHTWLGDVNTVIPALIFTGFPWVNGSNTLILLAGLLNIPGELYDAAKIDGAGTWQTFWNLELPLLKGPIRLILVFSLIGAVQGYGGILIMTNGGPANASMVPGLWLYKNAFQFNRYGYASAIGVILFVVLIAFTIASQRVMRSEVEFDANRN